MFSAPRVVVVVIVLFELFVPVTTSAQVNFEKSGYYLSLGDSVAAGEGALPVTHGFVYQLYDRRRPRVRSQQRP